MTYQILSERTAPPVKVSCPKDLMPFLKRYANARQEHVLLATLDGAQNLLKLHIVSIGLLNRAIVHPREIFIRAIKDNSASVILIHSHPSGNLEASREDREVTTRMVSAGNLLGIPVLDHVIIGRSGFYSFKENGEIL